MTQQQIDYAQKCVHDNIHDFYIWRQWTKLRKQVLIMDHGECQEHRRCGKYAKATMVHHVNHVKDRPDLALEIYFFNADGQKERNLISLCHACHEKIHGNLGPIKQKTQPITPERW